MLHCICSLQARSQASHCRWQLHGSMKFTILILLFYKTQPQYASLYLLITGEEGKPLPLAAAWERDAGDNAVEQKQFLTAMRHFGK